MKFILLLTAALISIVSCAQPAALYFENLGMPNGLSHPKVNCIIQDRRGFMWIGTDDGLNRYDGKTFVRFHHRPGDSASLSGNIITALLEDKEDRIWIATADGGLTRYDYRLAPQIQFKQYKHLPDNARSIPVNGINALLQDSLGFLWLGTDGSSVLRFHKDTEQFENITKSAKTVLALSLDKAGIIWVGREGGGLLKINPVTLAFSEDHRYSNLYAKLPHVTITALYSDENNDTWFGSWDKVLYRHTAVSGAEEVFQKNGPFTFVNDELTSFAESPKGRLWMGGKEKGLHVYDRAEKRFYNFRYDPARAGSIADDHVNCIYADRQGRMWLGTNRGLSINFPEKQQFVQNFLPSNDSLPITVYDFFEDGNNNIWIGTSTGLFIRQPNGLIKHVPLLYKGTPLQATSFFYDDDGSLYIGTNVSLFKYNIKTNALTLLPNTDKDGVMNRIIESRVVSIVKDTIDGNPVLITSPYGHFMAYYDFNNKRWVSRLDSRNIVKSFDLKDNLIRRFYKTKRGDVWLAMTREGLGFWQNDSQPKVQYFQHNPLNASSITDNNIYDMAEDKKGNLWVSTYGGGLNYFSPKTGTSTSIASSNNLLEGLQLDQHGYVWMISNGNLHKYDPWRKTFTSYDLPDVEKTGGIKGKIFRDSRGRLYVAGANYFISFHPDSVQEQRTAPKVFLTDFSIFNSSVSHLLYAKKEIELSYKDNYFSIEFAAPQIGRDVFYSYMLENFDRDWIDAGGRTYASYPNLEGGHYVFKVRVSNSPGVWNKEFVSVHIRIVPPFWKRWWFYLLLAIAIAAAIYGLYRYRINELLKRQAIRNKIAQDLHDNVGSTLSSISVYSQVAKIYHQQDKQHDLQTTLEKISETSSEMISELNDTVWAINPRNDNMNIILQRMESLARPLMASQDILFHFTHDEQLRTINLDMEKRKNLFLVFKESVNNVLKYAAAKNLWVSIKQKGSIVTMKITDDGKGFDLAKTSEGYKSSDVYGGGNGLRNMQLRAKEMKGTVRIESVPGKGCTVELHFPIT
jgi:ligand-binding sensor domain-containing protein/two-component sensor histidine kinase